MREFAGVVIAGITTIVIVHVLLNHASGVASEARTGVRGYAEVSNTFRS